MYHPPPLKALSASSSERETLSEESGMSRALAHRAPVNSGDEELSPGTSAVTDSSGRIWSIASAADSVFELNAIEAADLAFVSHRLVGEHDPNEIDDHELLVQAEVAARRASPDLIAALVHFRLRGSRDGILLLRG